MRGIWMRIFVGVMLGVGLLCGVARADVLLLKDGRIVDGPKMEWVEQGVTIHFENGDVLVPEVLFEDAIIEGSTRPYTPKDDREKEKIEKGLVPFEGKWMKPSRREGLIKRKLRDKKEEIAEIKQRSLWRDRWKEQTKHFAIESTAAPHITEYFRDMMEAYHTEFSKVWKVKQGKLGRLVVCFHGNRKKFIQNSGAPSNALGYFRFVDPIELNFFYDRLDPRYSEEVMFHEVNHYLQYLIDPEFSMPHFPGEAIAEYYGASTFDPVKKKLTVGLMQEGRLAGMKNEIDAGKMLGLKEMLETDSMFSHYSWGWSFVHFLMNDKRYRKKFEKWVLALARSKNIERVVAGNGKTTVKGAEVLRSFMKYHGVKSMDALATLEKEWHAYVTDKLDFVSGRGLAMAARSARRAGRPIRAKRLFTEAIATGDAGASAYHSLATLLEMDRQTDEAVKLWKQAIELDPLEGAYYAILGKVLWDQGEKEEGRRMAKLGLELSPEDAWLAFRVNEVIGD